MKVDIGEEYSQTILDNSQPIDTNDFLELNFHTEFPETYRDFGKIKPGTKFKIIIFEIYNIIFIGFKVPVSSTQNK